MLSVVICTAEKPLLAISFLRQSHDSHRINPRWFTQALEEELRCPVFPWHKPCSTRTLRSHETLPSTRHFLIAEHRWTPSNAREFDKYWVVLRWNGSPQLWVRAPAPSPFATREQVSKLGLVIQASGRLRQEDFWESEASLDYKSRPSLKTKIWQTTYKKPTYLCYCLLGREAVFWFLYFYNYEWIFKPTFTHLLAIRLWFLAF